jgi:3-oxoadipate enol-lactonase
MSKPELNWLQEGSGPALVLSHALGLDLRMYDAAAAILKDRYTVLRYDHRGHGQSEVVPGPYTLDMLADDAAQLISERFNGPVHFAGISMGGMTAQALAARHPQLVKSAVVANSASWYDEAARSMWQARVATVLDPDKGIAAISDGAMQRWFTPEFRANNPAAIAAWRTRLKSRDPAAYAASCDAVCNIDFRASNTTIACPVLVIAGSRDEATPPALSDVIHKAIPGSVLRSMDAAHISAIEQPEVFARLLDEFFSSQS